MKKSINVLYLAPFSLRANGAEEQDIVWGLKILQNNKSLRVYPIYLNLTKKTFITPNLENQILQHVGLKSIINYLKAYMFAFDNSMRQSFTFPNQIIISNLVKSLKIDLIITNTSSMLLYGKQKNVMHIHRSVSFEPIYVRKVLKNPLKFNAHSILKYLSLPKEFSADVILAISPRDKTYYERAKFNLPFKKIIVVPLRQFAYPIKPIQNKFNKKLNIAFMGSTYNVLHNKRSFQFVTVKLAPLLVNNKNVTINIYGKKLPKEVCKSSNIKIHNWVKNIRDIYTFNNCFVVPYFLASGMQSKVFEPLFYGKILICDPRVLSRYEFVQFMHYIPAKTPEDFQAAINWVIENPVEATNIGKNGQIFAKKIIGPKVIKSQMDYAIHLATKSGKD